MDFNPALLEAFELSLGLFYRTSMKSETISMFPHTMAFFLELTWVHLRQGLRGFFQGSRSGDQLPGAFALQDTSHQAFLTGGGQQSSVQIPELAFAVVVGAGQTWHIIAVKQAGCVSAGSFCDHLVEGLQAQIVLALDFHLCQISRQLLLHLSTQTSGLSLGVEQVCDAFQPIGSLTQVVIVRLGRLQGIVQSLMQLRQAWVWVLRHQTLQTILHFL